MDTAVQLVTTTWDDFWEDGGHRVAAALTYFTTFALGPFLILALTIGSFLFNKDRLQQEVTQIVSRLLNEEIAQIVGDMISNNPLEGNYLLTIVSVSMILYAAASIFSEVYKAVNHIWDVDDDEMEDGLMQRLFGLVYAILTSIVIIGLLIFNGLLPYYLENLWQDMTGVSIFSQIVTYIIGFIALSLIFALLFKFVPNRDVEWSDVAIGAVVSSFAFLVGQIAVNIYIGESTMTSLYGSAGALSILMIWVFYMYLVLLLGAEFTKVYASQHGTLRNTTSSKDDYAH